MLGAFYNRLMANYRHYLFSNFLRQQKGQKFYAMASKTSGAIASTINVSPNNIYFATNSIANTATSNSGSYITCSHSNTIPTGALIISGGGGGGSTSGTIIGPAIHIPNSNPGIFYPPKLTIEDDGSGKYHVQDDHPFKLALPDGALLDVNADGSYKLIDKDAKITYKACRVREFNTYLNASDKLEDFIKYCGTLGIKKREMLDLPINLFIAWLIIQSAKADQEPEPIEEIKLLEDLRRSDKNQLSFNFELASSQIAA